MGFSTSGAAAIIFVGLLIAVGIAFPALENAHDRRASAIDDRDDRALDMRNSAIEAEAVHDDGDVRVNVTNEGSTTLSIDHTDALLDGVYESPSSAVVHDDRTDETWADGERSVLAPGEVLELTFADAGAVERVKVVTEHGIAVTLTEVPDVG